MKRKVGRPRRHITPTVVKAQRYSAGEIKLIESVVDTPRDVGAFIRYAAVDLAQRLTAAQEE